MADANPGPLRNAVQFKTNSFPLELGKYAAESDASHDFGKAFARDTLRGLVQRSLPEQGDVNILKPTNEDTFISNILLQQGKNAAEMKISQDGLLDNCTPLVRALVTGDQENELVKSYFNPAVLERFHVRAYVRSRPRGAGGDEDETDAPPVAGGPDSLRASLLAGGEPDSKIQDIFQKAGVLQDLFIVCDVAYSGLRKDLTLTNREGEQKIYWLQNTQTCFDPAGKTALHTGQAYGFKTDDSNFRFAWVDASPGKRVNTLYPPWLIDDGPETGVPRPNYVNDRPPEMMLCTNKTLYMSTEVTGASPDDYKTHEARLLIRQKGGAKSTYVYADKALAAKTSKTFSKAAIASYLKMAKDFKVEVLSEKEWLSIVFENE